ncbi:hypothetical protein VTL71DRAFT_13086 [Oculimacula yallundae]|uniref:Uncharacterized protein n=1 Tax=Oculimacula yallundae TaxID=86028 RepID=A0ABR4CRM1_9HELO
MVRINAISMPLLLIILTLLLNIISATPVNQRVQQISSFRGPILASGAQTTDGSRTITGAPLKPVATPVKPTTTLPPPEEQNCGNIYIARGENKNFVVPTTKTACPTSKPLDARHTGVVGTEVDPDSDGTIFIARGPVVPNAPVTTSAPVSSNTGKQTQTTTQMTSGPTASTSSASPIYIARDGNLGQQKYPLVPPQLARDILEAIQTAPAGGLPWQGETGGGFFNAKDENNHDTAPPVQRRDDSHHKPTFKTLTLTTPRLKTLTVAASTGRVTGGVVVITGPQSHKSHTIRLSKTYSAVKPGTFTGGGGSGTFTVATYTLHSGRDMLVGRMPPPGWFAAHSNTHRPASLTTAKHPTHHLPSTMPIPSGALLVANTLTHKPAPTPSYTLTVKRPTLTTKGNVKQFHTSTTTVTQYHSCEACLLEHQPMTSNR